MLVGFKSEQLLVGAQRNQDGGAQFLAGQFGFGLIVVDIILADDRFFGRFSRLACAQNNPNRFVAKGFTHIFHQRKPGLVGLHHHIEQCDGDIRMRGNQPFRLARRVCRKEAKLTAVVQQPLQS